VVWLGQEGALVPEVTMSSKYADKDVKQVLGDLDRKYKWVLRRAFYRFWTKLFTNTRKKIPGQEWPLTKAYRYIFPHSTFTFRWRYLFKMIPFVNTMWDLFFDESKHSKEAVKSLLDVFALLNALLLGSGLSLASSVTYDDLIKADARFTKNIVDGSAIDEYTGLPYHYKAYWDYWYGESPPSTQFFYYCGNAITLLFVNILILVYVYGDVS